MPAVDPEAQRDPTVAAGSRWRSLRRFALLAAVFAAVLLGASGARAEVLNLSRALRLDGDPAGANPWNGGTLVALPDAWTSGSPASGSVAWYRFDFPGRFDPSPLLAIYLDRVCSSSEVYLNGVLLADSRSSGSARPKNCLRPLLIPFPAGMLRPDANRLEIRVSGRSLDKSGSTGTAAGIATVQIGERAALEAREDRRFALAVAAPGIESLMLVVCGLFFAAFGWIYRPRSSLWYFGWLTVCWGLLAGRNWLVDLPATQQELDVLYSVPIALVLLTAAQFVIRFTGHRFPRIDMIGIGQTMVMPLSLALAGPSRTQVLSIAWMILLITEILALAGYFIAETWHGRRRRIRPIATGAAVVALGLIGEALAPVHPSGMPIVLGAAVHAVVAVLLLAVGMQRVKRSGQRPLPIATEPRDIEARVREATAQIERNFATLADMKIEQTTERERKRIAADLHDDLGAKLLTIVHTSDNDRISTLAREALEEMRLSVRGLTGKPVRLADAMGDWRAEVVARLSQAGIEANWSSPSDDDVPQTISARAFVQTTRILRESVSNTIKHSRASQCSVSCLIAGGDFQLVVQDNGNGIPTEIDGRMDGGHGLASMKQRAKQLQGQCLMESGPGYGTVIRLNIPLDPHVEAV